MKEGTYEDTKLLNYVIYEKANMHFLSDKISLKRIFSSYYIFRKKYKIVQSISLRG